MHILQEVATAISTKDTSLDTAHQRVNPDQVTTRRQRYAYRESLDSGLESCAVENPSVFLIAAEIIPTNTRLLGKLNTTPSIERELIGQLRSKTIELSA